MGQELLENNRSILCGGIILEEALDLSSDRLLNNNNNNNTLQWGACFMKRLLLKVTLRPTELLYGMLLIILRRRVYTHPELVYGKFLISGYSLISLEAERLTRFLSFCLSVTSLCCRKPQEIHFCL